MDIQRKEFEKWYFNENYKDTTACKLKVFEVLSGLVGVESPYNGTYLNYNVQTSWKAWQQAKKVAVPDGFILVEKSKLLQILGSAVAINEIPKTKINLSESNFIISEVKAMFEAQEQI